MSPLKPDVIKIKQEQSRAQPRSTGHKGALPLMNAAQPSTAHTHRLSLKSTHTVIPENVAKPQIIEKSNLKQDNKTKLRTSDEGVMLFPGLFGVFSGRGVQELIFWWLGWLNSAPRNTVRAIVSY